MFQVAGPGVSCQTQAEQSYGNVCKLLFNLCLIFHAECSKKVCFILSNRPSSNAICTLVKVVDNRVSYRQSVRHRIG